MSKNMLAVLLVSVCAFGTVTASAAGLSDNMKTLNANLQIVEKTDDAAALKDALTEMRAAAQSAKAELPAKLKGKAADSAEVKDYHHGYDVLTGQIDEALKLAGEGKIQEAKAMTEQLKATRGEYHKKYR
ncbi:cytochrome b562 [Morganella morganii]|uniref:Cytochrome b562 n=1 Tax=Morganella morganii TaxID=582 RepID=A0A9Q4GR36_MORMO|nr:cytochrome b562 [Morganella morganii]BEP20096.1 cytochrome b562 [Morganella morganii subsp. sibonii]HDS6842920.1 cytochrome b562 [Morganella morganii subsp. morganii]EGT3623194.1 cytochrome b562 [Morganella morganii]EGT3629092.1 cytochrome b562 [Morganella morganii]EGT3633183.1 cytochrome b562 [Morganella morganii]